MIGIYRWKYSEPDPFLCSSGTGAAVLQKAQVRIINSTVCKGLLQDELTDRMLCAGVLSGGVDACQVGADPQNPAGSEPTGGRGGSTGTGRHQAEHRCGLG